MRPATASRRPSSSAGWPSAEAATMACRSWGRIAMRRGLWGACSHKCDQDCVMKITLCEGFSTA